MALHNVDGGTGAVDVAQVVPLALGTTSIAPTQEGQTTGKVVIKDNQVIVNDGDNDRVLVGHQAGGF